MELIDQIKQQFPAPIPADADDGMSDSYCVGGAICMYADLLVPESSSLAFPDNHHIARALIALGAELAYEHAYDYARDIAQANDDGKAWKAWDIAAKALRHRA